VRGLTGKDVVAVLLATPVRANVTRKAYVILKENYSDGRK
jgi:hypothetical protein